MNLALPSLAQPATTVAVPAIRTVELSKWIDDRPILEEIDLTISPGSFVALLGANGAGKSTLLRILATLVPATQGRIELFGHDIAHGGAALRARIGMIGHQAMLYRDLTALENLVFFGRLYGLDNAGPRAMDLLELVGLANRADDAAKTFSRGMAQRLAIARALMHEPDLLLADEPFAGLDLPSAKTLENLLAGLHRQGKTVVLVNHDIPQSLALAQRVVVLREGCIALDRASRGIDLQRVVDEVSRP